MVMIHMFYLVLLPCFILIAESSARDDFSGRAAKRGQAKDAANVTPPFPTTPLPIPMYIYIPVLSWFCLMLYTYNIYHVCMHVCIVSTKEGIEKRRESTW